MRQAYTYAMDMQISWQQVQHYSIDPINGHGSKPPPEYLKLNVDGGFLDGQGTFGDLLRIEDGIWLWGFACKFKEFGPLHADLKALQMGM